MAQKKELETNFVENIEAYVKTGNLDAQEDFVASAQLLIGMGYYKPMTPLALYKKITKKDLEY